MARLAAKPYSEGINLSDFSPAGLEKAEKWLDEIQKKSLAVDLNKSLVGVLVRFPGPDSPAYYIVTADVPLTLAHIPIFDAYRASAAEIRGTRRQDIIAMEKADRQLLNLFRPKEE